MLAKQLLADWPLEQWRDRRLLIGVSGGADSVALLLALRELSDSSQLVVAHLNHGWRGKESDEDAAFVVKLADRLGLQCLSSAPQDRDRLEVSQNDGEGCCENAMLAKAIGVHGDVIEDAGEQDAKADLESELQSVNKTEEKARRVRYDFFKQSAYSVGASYVVTAHTADDRIETLLHNMLRGSGPAGAASLVMFRPFDDDLVLARPLLRKRRAEIEAFLASRGQCYRQDSSNSWSCYKRNFLRREVLPLVASHYPSADRSLLNFSELTEELMADCGLLAERWLAEAQQAMVSPAVRLRSARTRWPEPKYLLIPLAALSSMPWSIVQMALRQAWTARGWPLADMSRMHWQAIRQLGEQSTGVVNLPAGRRAEAAEGFLAIG